VRKVYLEPGVGLLEVRERHAGVCAGVPHRVGQHHARVEELLGLLPEAQHCKIDALDDDDELVFFKGRS